MVLKTLLGAAFATAAVVYAQSEADLQSVYERRLPFLAASSSSSRTKVETYLSTLQDDGTWEDVNYATGCDAQRANWPAAVGHWNKILAMAAAYHGDVKGADEYAKSPELRTALSEAMEYWFANDFSTIGNGACMDGGGKEGDLCPCGTPGLWNTNWYSNVILVPTRVGSTCVLLRDELTPTELGNCTHITACAYTPFFRNPQPGYVAGANTIEIAGIGISNAMLENNRTGNATRLLDAYGASSILGIEERFTSLEIDTLDRSFMPMNFAPIPKIEGAHERIHNQVMIQPEDRVDGIKPDGSFHQHIGIVYDGNYGKDFSNWLLELELSALGTPFQANETVKDAFGQHINGAQWMIFGDKFANVLHWDYTVIGRMIAFALSDSQASANIKMNLTLVQALGDAWNSTHLQNFAEDLNEPIETGNAGTLNGNRMFWNSDYMVHRTDQTVTTLKLISNRTKTSECVNSANPLGFHLSDGAMYQCTTGAEYLDMNDHRLPRDDIQLLEPEQFGVETYAGGVSAGDVGVAAMRYTNPLTKAFSFRKAWFFFKDNVQHVLVNGISSATSAPVLSVLDQRLHNDSVYIDGEIVSSGSYSNIDSLWHNGTGYIFPESQCTELLLQAEEKTGSWKDIGTSAAANSTKDMFVASVVHDSDDLGAPLEYSIFPATESNDAFEDKADSCTPKTIANDENVSAALDAEGRTLGAAFWTAGGGSVRVAKMGLTVHADRALVLMLKLTGEGNQKGEVYVADPNHATGTAKVRLVWSSKANHDRRRMIGHSGSNHIARTCSTRHGPAKEVTLEFELPEGGFAGSGLVKTFE